MDSKCMSICWECTCTTPGMHGSVPALGIATTAPLPVLRHAICSQAAFCLFVAFLHLSLPPALNKNGSRKPVGLCITGFQAVLSHLYGLHSGRSHSAPPCMAGSPHHLAMLWCGRYKLNLKTAVMALSMYVAFQAIYIVFAL